MQSPITKAVIVCIAIIWSCTVLVDGLIIPEPYLPGLWPHLPTGPTSKPVLQGDFPDPSIIRIDGVIYTFSTTSGGLNVPVATEQQGQGMQRLTMKDSTKLLDAMPTLPKWTDGGIWAPDVVQIPDGSFVLHFSGSKPGTGKHCIGVATSKNVIGPYQPLDSPLACPLDQGGAIDSSGFTDSDGSLWVVYKIDGNSLSKGHNGPCGNADGKHDTWLMLQQLDGSGTNPVGDPIRLLNRGKKDGPLIEAPSLVKSSNGIYVLFFSSNCYNSPLYDISYATSSSLKGPYTKSKKSLLLPGDHGLFSPGGATVTPDGKTMVYHADLKWSDASVRQMYINDIDISGTNVDVVFP